MPPNAPATIGRYEVVERLGYGGMGVVYRARDPRIGRQVAIKMLRVGGDHVRARFFREAQAAGALKHPNIVTIYDVGEHDDQPFIVMEFVKGKTLAEYIRDRIFMRLDRKLALMESLAAGLGYAHAQGVIHRDVKPANLMIDLEGTLKILDFGIGRRDDSELTQPGEKLGTPNYMSPEAAQGEDTDRRSDIFAVGLVFYETLCYQQAFPGKSPRDVMDAILHAEPRPLTDLCPDLDPAVMSMVARALQKRPDDRYQTLFPMVEEIARVRKRLPPEEDEPPEEPTVQVVPPPMEEDMPPTIEEVAAAPPIDEVVAPRRRLHEIFQDLGEQETPRLDAVSSDPSEISHAETVRLPAVEEQVEPVERTTVIDAQAEIRASILDKLARTKAFLDEARLPEAIAVFDEVLALAPDLPMTIDLGRAIQAAVHERRKNEIRERDASNGPAGLASIAVNSIDVLLRQAADALERRDFEAAHHALDRAAEIDPASERLTALRGRAQAHAEFEQTRRRMDEDFRARAAVSLARQRAAAGDVARALTELEQFAPSHPLVAQALRELRGHGQGREAGG
jgi:eukaryotic-like serine/threonine-protein kinase